MEEAPQEAVPRRRNPLGWLLLAALVGVVMSHILGSHGPKVGGAAPDLTFPMLGGGEERLAAHHGNVVLLDFWATWCPPCVESLPVVHRVAQEFREDGLVTLAVNRDEGRNREALVEAFLARHAISGLDVALDDGTAAGALGVRALPTLVVIDRQGQVASAHVGAMGEEALRSLLAEAVAR